MDCGNGTCGKARLGDACRVGDCYDCWLRIHGAPPRGTARPTAARPLAAAPPPDRGPCVHLAARPCYPKLTNACTKAVSEGRIYLCQTPDEAKRKTHRFVTREYCRFRCQDHEPATNATVSAAPPQGAQP